MKLVLVSTYQIYFPQVHIFIAFSQVFHVVLVSYQVLICQNNTFVHFQDDDGSIVHVSVKMCVLVVYVVVFKHQRWSEYNTNVLEYEYDYFEHA